MPEEVIRERLLKATDIAQRLSISRSLAYRLIQQGKIPVVRVNGSVRVQTADLEEYIRRHHSDWSGTLKE